MSIIRKPVLPRAERARVAAMREQNRSDAARIERYNEIALSLQSVDLTGHWSDEEQRRQLKEA